MSVLVVMFGLAFGLPLIGISEDSSPWLAIALTTGLFVGLAPDDRVS